MRTIATTLLLATLAACGADDDDSAGPDAAPSLGDAAASTVPSECAAYTSEVKLATGERFVTTTKAAHVKSIHKGDAFIVEQCDAIVAGPVGCPAGATCTGSGGPTGQVCVVSRSATFIDDGLYVVCETEQTSYDRAGAMFAHTLSGYRTLKITKP